MTRGSPILGGVFFSRPHGVLLENYPHWYDFLHSQMLFPYFNLIMHLMLRILANCKVSGVNWFFLKREKSKKRMFIAFLSSFADCKIAQKKLRRSVDTFTIVRGNTQKKIHNANKENLFWSWRKWNYQRQLSSSVPLKFHHQHIVSRQKYI